MMPRVWSTYRPGKQQPEHAQEPPTDPAPYDVDASRPRYEPPVTRAALPRPLPRPFAPRPGIRAGGHRSSGGAGIAIAAVGIVAAVAMGVAAASGAASPEDEYADWYDCIESYQEEEPGLLTPADLCEIGHERPPGYSEYDDYDFDPFDPDRYDSWGDVENGDDGYRHEYDY